MSATITTCSDCGCVLTDPNAVMFGLCIRHIDDWFQEAIASAPKVFHPTSSMIATASVNARARREANEDILDAMVRVQCSECPRVYRMEDVPDGPWVCPECEGDVERDAWA